MRYIKSKRVAASISFDKIINKTVIQDVERTPSDTENTCHAFSDLKHHHISNDI